MRKTIDNIFSIYIAFVSHQHLPNISNLSNSFAYSSIPYCSDSNGCMWTHIWKMYLFFEIDLSFRNNFHLCTKCLYLWWSRLTKDHYAHYQIMWKIYPVSSAIDLILWPFPLFIRTRIICNEIFTAVHSMSFIQLRSNKITKSTCWSSFSEWHKYK